MKPPRTGLKAGLLGVVLLAAPLAASGTPFVPTGPTIAVVVSGATPAVASAAVRAAGGTVRVTLDIVGGVAADVPASAVAALQGRGLAVTPDGRAGVSSAGFAAATGDVQLAALDPGPEWNTDAGAGVGVALIDTGVADVPDLAGRVVHGLNLSGENDGLDHFGHGTFMAGLMVGDGAAGAAGSAGAARHTGVAPGAHVVSVKVAGRDGVTSLSQILEAISWVVEHAEEQNVRVLNLSFGFDSPVAWGADPLSMAVEQAWASGITVVAAAGNDGAGTVGSPGRDPWVITAGASDPQGTAATDDDSVPSWSGWNRKGPFSKPDVVAPGVSVISLRAPGSLVDKANPSARIGDAYFRGSGTSMATALTSGVAAAIISDHPDAVPDDVKGALVSTSHPIAGSPGGAVDLQAADAAPSDATWWQEHPVAGDAAGLPERMPWTENGRWDTSRWYTSRWYTSRWYTSRWYTSRWYTSRWYTSRWYTSRWYTSRWYTSRWYTSRWYTSRWYTSRWYGGWATLDWRPEQGWSGP
jgi:serine protease AprX